MSDPRRVHNLDPVPFKPCMCDTPHDGICDAAIAKAALFYQQYRESRGVKPGYDLSFDQKLEFATCFAEAELEKERQRVKELEGLLK